MLTVSGVHNARVEEPSLFDFTLTSYILEADGSTQFLRSDGAMKFFHSNYSAMLQRN